MKSCIVICRSKKPPERKGKILFINAAEEIRQETTMSYLDPIHIKKISESYGSWKNDDGFSRVVDLETIQNNGGRLSVPLYVQIQESNKNTKSAVDNTKFWIICSNELNEFVDSWRQSEINFHNSMEMLL